MLNSVKHDVLDRVQFVQLSLIGWELEFTQSSVFDLVPLPDSIDPSPKGRPKIQIS